MLKQSLQQKLLQKLSPQQIQVIKLLELPTLQLEERIKKELEENPVLDEGGSEETVEDDYQDEEHEVKDKDQEEFSIEDYMDDDDTPSYKLAAQNYSKDDKHEDIPFSGGTTFHEQLISQLGLRILAPEKAALAEYLIGNIDEDGYLRRDMDSIVDDLAFSTGINTTFEELVELLHVIQDFDPVGIGARDLQECLLLQIKRKGSHNPDVKNAHIILKKYFDEFTRKHYEKIQKRLSLDDEDFKCAVDEILRLNPKPGGAFSNPMSKPSPTIIPDFILGEEDGDLNLSLNSRNVPDLHISRSYAEMLKDYSSNKDNQSKEQKDAVMFVKQKLDSAKWFIDAIRQRQNTLMLSMQAIINFQHAYFLEGDEKKLRPMILKDISELTSLDISTISRVSNSKYIQTHFGIFSLKYFFSEGLQTDTGEEVSTREIKNILRECVDNEDKKKPLTDDRLAAILKEKSYVIARRTVAKYREQLNIPVARLRKEL
ncbi:MAG: RNA polymerase sigma-54 factor [Ancylomarina sp.]|jgi:RNA polymerase sigma-54 factor